MANSYPTSRNYRGTKPGTVREPGPSRRPSGPAPRRTPGRPAPRARPSYRPAPPAALPKPPGKPSRGFIGAASRAFRGLGPYAGAFGVGYALGSIIFHRPGQAAGWQINNPAGWREFIATEQCDPAGGLRGPVPTTYAITQGVNANNNICFQAVPVFNPTNTARGYWVDQVGWENSRFTHIASFTRTGASGIPIDPKPTITAIPAVAPRPQLNPDPWLREQVGGGLRINPGLSPVIMNPIGPEVVGRPSTAPKPVPGVGPEGYQSGEPGGKNQPGSNPSPQPNPVPRPNPNPSRPPRNVRERKAAASRLYGLAAGTLGFVTETEDLLDAFHKSLKKGCGKGVSHKNQSAKAKPVWEAGGDTYRWKRIWTGKYSKWVRDKGQYRAPSFLEKWDAVYANFDCVDLGAFWDNYIDNQAEDALFGTASKDDAEASKRNRPGIRIGIGTGPAL